MLKSLKGLSTSISVSRKLHSQVVSSNQVRNSVTISSEKKLISSVPWDDAGNFIRFSATFVADTVEEEERIAKIIDERLSSETFIF